jgi:flagellar biosynthesis/type III secretory pathway M-ring protein FliF/YscJ
VFVLVLAFVIRRVKRRRERKMKWRQMQQQQQQQPQTEAQQPNHMIAQPVDFAPANYSTAVPNYSDNSSRPVNP